MVLPMKPTNNVASPLNKTLPKGRGTSSGERQKVNLCRAPPRKRQKKRACTHIFKSRYIEEACRPLRLALVTRGLLSALDLTVRSKRLDKRNQPIRNRTNQHTRESRKISLPEAGFSKGS